VVTTRLELIRRHYIENPEIGYNEWVIKDLLKKHNLSMPLYEKVLTNPLFRLAAISYTLTLYLLIFNPFK
jgi:hypothetical protein